MKITVIIRHPNHQNPSPLLISLFLRPWRDNVPRKDESKGKARPGGSFLLGNLEKFVGPWKILKISGKSGFEAFQIEHPRCSMYGIFTYIYPLDDPVL